MRQIGRAFYNVIATHWLFGWWTIFVMQSFATGLLMAAGNWIWVMWLVCSVQSYLNATTFHNYTEDAAMVWARYAQHCFSMSAVSLGIGLVWCK